MQTDFNLQEEAGHVEFLHQLYNFCSELHKPDGIDAKTAVEALTVKIDELANQYKLRGYTQSKPDTKRKARSPSRSNKQRKGNNSNAIKDALSELDEVNSLLLLSLSTAVQSKLKAINIEIRDIGECCSCSQNVQSPEVF